VAGAIMMRLSLRAPMAVAVEIRAPARRVFRLAWNVGEDGVKLQRALPFEPGRPVELAFTLPDGDATLALRAEVGSPDGDGQDKGDGVQVTELVFSDPPQEARAAIRRYVHERLGLPG
jgi:PilZ domain-containing protein